MEIIFEIVLQILGWIFQVFAELLIQIVGEAIAELIGQSVTKRYRRPAAIPPFWAAILHLGFGAIAGAVSLFIFPTLFIKTDWLRIANLVITPLIAGMLMGFIGAWRREHEKSLIRLDTFSYGFCFAFSMAFVRHLFAS